MRALKLLSRGFWANKTVYAVQRIFLSRFFRLRITLAGIVLLAASLAIWRQADPAKFESAAEWVEFQADAIINRPPFLLNHLRVEASSPDLENEILAAAALHFPVSVLDIDFKAVRDRIAALDQITDANIVATDQNVLRISVEERTPVAVWRNGGELELVDADGGRVGFIASRAERVDLSLISGEGAVEAVGESLEIFRTARPFEHEIRGLVRIGERRWNLELEGGRIILLPEYGAVEALEEFMVGDRAKKVLQADFELFDLRLAERPTVRLREPKPGEI